MDEPLRRYRLALALIPDPDPADDLFMVSRSEADLRRRAARWRERQGLPPAAENPILPELDAGQREHALHLARRGAAHRRMTLWLTTLVVAVGLVAGGFLLREAMLPRLDSHPAFAGEPVAEADGMGDLTLTIYQAEVKLTPVKRLAWDIEVAIWWEVRGPGAADAYRLFEPQLRMAHMPLPATESPPVWLENNTTQRYSSRPDRVLGVTRFTKRIQDDDGVDIYERSVIFRLREGRGTEPDFAVRLHLPPPVAE